MSAFDFFDSRPSHSCKFKTPGETHTGVITEISDRMPVTKYGTTDPDYWPDGSPKQQVVITLATDERDPEDPNDTGERSLWVTESRKAGTILAAIIQATRQANAKLEIGGTLSVSFTGHDPNSKNPAQPRKLYAATYQPPAAGGGMFEQQPAQPEPQAAPTASQPTAPQQQVPQTAPVVNQQPAQTAPAAPAQQLSDATVTGIKGLIAAGLDDATISSSLTAAGNQVSPEQVAQVRAAA
jgi:hypothetical protein BBIF_0082|nr:MAG TPA: hypothetical protein [Caudoviricetes sp.]